MAKIAYNQRLRRVFALFFGDVLRFFAPVWAELLDAESVEIIGEAPDLSDSSGTPGPLLQNDLLARVKFKNKPKSTLLIHIEIEVSDTLAEMGKRMFEYFAGICKALRQKPETAADADRLVPLVVFIKAAYDGIGEYTVRMESPLPPISSKDKTEKAKLLDFTYNYIGLRGFQAQQALDQRNSAVAALAGLMAYDDSARPRMKAQALNLIARSSHANERKIILAEALDTYMTLKPEEMPAFEKQLELEGVPSRDELPMFKWFEARAEARGKAEGKADSLQQTIRRLATRRFGAPAAEELAALEALRDLERLQRLIDWLDDHRAGNGNWTALLQVP